MARALGDSATCQGVLFEKILFAELIGARNNGKGTVDLVYLGTYGEFSRGLPGTHKVFGFPAGEGSVYVDSVDTMITALVNNDKVWILPQASNFPALDGVMRRGNILWWYRPQRIKLLTVSIST